MSDDNSTKKWAFCRWCGKPFYPLKNAKTCGGECSKAWAREYHRQYIIRHHQESNYSRAYYERNIEKLREQARERYRRKYAENPDAERARSRSRSKDPAVRESKRKIMILYRKKHPEKGAEYARKQRAKDPEKMRGHVASYKARKRRQSAFLGIIELSLTNESPNETPGEKSDHGND